MNKKTWSIGDPVFEGDQECPLYKSWPWNGHRLFAYDLIKHMEPSLIVELGTYWGGSFYSFCQSVKDHSLSTRCVAVDTWKGDEHTGAYADTVFQTVEKIRTLYYPNVEIEFKRMLFGEAADAFADNSINMLHIDGLHTYKAVEEDYRTWLPKLAENGIVLFHDIADSCDYGSVRFWKAISRNYPSYTFQHSWGLGVLFPKGDDFYRFMEKNNFMDKQQSYTYKSELALAQLQVSDLEHFNREQDAVIKQLEQRLENEITGHRALERDLERLNSSHFIRLLRRAGLFTK